MGASLTDEDGRPFSLCLGAVRYLWVGQSGLRCRSGSFQELRAFRPVMGSRGAVWAEQPHEAVSLMSSTLKMRELRQEHLAELTRKGAIGPPLPLLAPNAKLEQEGHFSTWNGRGGTFEPGNQENGRAQSPAPPSNTQFASGTPPDANLLT